MRDFFHLLLAISLAALLGAGSPLAGQPKWSDGSPIQPPENLIAVAHWTNWPARRWAGPALWCNRLQDWEVRDGALFSQAPADFPVRTAHLLTYDLSGPAEPFRLRVETSVTRDSIPGGFAGFLVGAGEGRLDYRGAALVHHFPGRGGGLLAVLEAPGGQLSFRDMSAETNAADYPMLAGQVTVRTAADWDATQPVWLALEGVPAAAGQYVLRLAAWSPGGDRLLAAAELPNVPTSKLRGNVALVSHNGGQRLAHRFRSFQVGGGRLAHHPERAFGPVAGTLYTIASRTLKLSAQFLPLAGRVALPPPPGSSASRQRGGGVRLAAHLELRMTDGSWKIIDGPKAIAGPDFYVPFRVENWDATRDAVTRVVFRDIDGALYHYETRITADPAEKPVVSVAGFTGMGVMGRIASRVGPTPGPGETLVGRWRPANVWMPFADAVRAVQRQDVDLLFFTGDQVYEGKPSPKDQSFEPQEDYLYKWILWHWSFRDLTNHLPAVVQPDDHDVYHGNLWGWGGRLNLTGHNSGGGYLCSPYFVNMVHRTQSGHLPDAYDPRPIRNGISNYYTTFSWGGVGFAVLEDRKFKSPGQIEDPAEQVLLGPGQQRMLREWGEDWTNQQVKCVVSQTIYAAMHVSFDGSLSGDRDTDGFPKVRRDEVVHLFRRTGAFVLSGDQHLSTFARLGIERPSDAVYEFAVPAIGNIFWRWFYPTTPGLDRGPGEPDYAGEFVDQLGNYFRMIAVANPERRSLLGQRLRQRYLIPAAEARNGLGDETRTSRGDGYGVLRFDKRHRQLTVECWPHDADPKAGGKPFPGWPITLPFEDLDGRRPTAWLPDLEINAPANPVIKLIDQRTGEVVKISRVRPGRYSPGVFETEALYTIKADIPETESPGWRASGLKPTTQPGQSTLPVELR